MAPVLVAEPEGTHIFVARFEGTIMLYCEGTGFPIPDIAWYRNGSALDASEEDNVTVTHNKISPARTVSSSLVITIPTFNKSGEYHCNLSSSVRAYEDLMSQVALVVVLGKRLTSLLHCILNWPYNPFQILHGNHKT